MKRVWASATLTQRRGKLQLLMAAMPTKVQQDYVVLEISCSSHRSHYSALVLASVDTAYAAQDAAEQATGRRHMLATAEGGGGSLIVVIEAGDSYAVRATPMCSECSRRRRRRRRSTGWSRRLTQRPPCAWASASAARRPRPTPPR
jgi:hypothetical protein